MKGYILKGRTIEAMQVTLKEITGTISLLVRGFYYIVFNFFLNNTLLTVNF
jgi:hypothetical protein